MGDLTAQIVETITSEVQLLAAIAYGEASTAGNAEEISGIAHAVAIRAKAWGNKTIHGILAADRNYTYAANGKNVRFNALKSAKISTINANIQMRIAINSASAALSGSGEDPSGGAYWWDGYDLAQKHSYNPRISHGFKYGDPSHNIFSMAEILIQKTIYKVTKNKKTGETKRTIIAEYDCAYVSTAAHGGTIFWRYNPDFVAATKTKEYR